MTQDGQQINVEGRMIASPARTEATFEEKNIKVSARASEPKLLIFSVGYKWEEQGDTNLNEWDFQMNLTDGGGNVLYSDYKHFGEDAPTFVDEKDLKYREYLSDDNNYQSGTGTMAKSIQTPNAPGDYTYKFQIKAQFWSRRSGEETPAKNITESIGECTVQLSVR
jgi:hypothetical protein